MGKDQLIVLGSGGNATDALDTIQSQYEIVAFVDDEPSRHGSRILDIPVMSRAALHDFPAAKVISMIGSEKTFSRRAEIIDSFNVPLDRFATVIHRQAFVSKYSKIGRDVIIYPGVIIPSNASIGNHIFILPNTILHHDVIIDDYAIIGSGVVIAGSAVIGRSTFVGSGSAVKNGVKIGAHSLIGMSANVLRSCDEGSVLVGNPAKSIRTSST